MVLMGAPGAGKGTQAMRISQSRGVPHVSTGDIFRKHIESRTELGRKVEPLLQEGHLAPDELAVQVVAERLAEGDCKRGYILDGFPRSRVQAAQLDELLRARGDALTCVINIVADDDEIVDRLSARRLCPSCGAIYNLKFNPPAVPGICNNAFCGGTELIHREDDHPETIRERLRVYHGTTEPILDFYRKSGLLRDVKGSGSTPDQIFDKIDSLITETEALARP